MGVQTVLFDNLQTPYTAVAHSVEPDSVPLVTVAIENTGDHVYDYALPSPLRLSLRPGQRLSVPFGKNSRPRIGFCVGFPEKTTVSRVKYILDVIDPFPLLDPDRMRLAEWISRYYCSPLGDVLSAMVPAAVKKQAGLVRIQHVRLTDAGRDAVQVPKGIRLSPMGKKVLDYLRIHPVEGIPRTQILADLHTTAAPLNTLIRAGLIEMFTTQEFQAPPCISASPQAAPAFQLNSDQVEALAQISEHLPNNRFHTILLHGVTGSGKTEIYIRSIQQILERGRQALVLVPEIALTPQTESRFLARFPNIAVLHSALSPVERHRHWRNIAQGLASVVIGARSAVFAPLPNLGLIIVDEEHEPSYKQDTTPRYHARDVAVKLAQLKNIPVILGSATPSLETYHNSQMKPHYQMIRLPRRVNELPLPEVRIVDMASLASKSKSESLLSSMLESELEVCLGKKHQAILLLNRRGHSRFLLCPSCKFALNCPNCDVKLTYHKPLRQFETQQKSWMLCHHCLHSSQVSHLCPVCGKKLLLLGPGTQQAEELLQQKFPRASIQRMDSDAIQPSDYHSILQRFEHRQIDILVGTQMIGKGLDYPNVTLVGVLNADTALAIPDFRSSERTFQIIAQVAGRCGRGFSPGLVIVQTFLPDDPAIRFACRHDYETFAKCELDLRKRCQTPPHGRLARILLRNLNLQNLEKQSLWLRQKMDKKIHAMSLPVHLIGPAPAGIARLERYYRYQIILRAISPDPIQKLLAELRKKELWDPKILTAVDVDPIHLL